MQPISINSLEITRIIYLCLVIITLCRYCWCAAYNEITPVRESPGFFYGHICIFDSINRKQMPYEEQFTIGEVTFTSTLQTNEEIKKRMKAWFKTNKPPKRPPNVWVRRMPFWKRALFFTSLFAKFTRK